MPQIESLPHNAPLVADAPRPRTKRYWYTFDGQGARCLIVGADGAVRERLNGYWLTEIRSGALSALGGPGCYAFYCGATHQVKIGHSLYVDGRWLALEKAMGTYLQPLMKWESPDIRHLERRLHDRFADARTIGEWFDADAVLPYLRNAVTPEVVVEGWVGSRPDVGDNDYITEEQLSAWINVGVKVLEQWRKNQSGPTYIALNGSQKFIRYRKTDIDEWLKTANITPHRGVVAEEAAS